MILLLSPAKNLDYKKENPYTDYSVPKHLDKSEVIIHKMRTLSQHKLMSLMDISEELAKLNVERYKGWQTPFTLANARQAAITFNGEVYWGLNALDFNEQEQAFAQAHLRILSGLHGLLKPLDLIMPYRLEMGSKIAINRKKNLYEFWKEAIAQDINELLQFQPSEKSIINLASKEYFTAVNTKLVNGKITTIDFKEIHDGKLKSLQFFLKKARGWLARYAIKNQITKSEDLKHFNQEGYSYSAEHSNDTNWTFIRPLQK